MKRIISLILVAVMALAVFTGCAYKYSDDEMSNYADFDRDAFTKALTDLTIVVTEGDFGTGKDGRDAKVQDAIFGDLAGKLTDELKEGTPDVRDLVYYAYYITDKDGNQYSTDKMDVSKKAKLQLGMGTLEGISKAIAEAMTGKDIKDYLYSTSTTGETKAGDWVCLSYTLEYVDYVYKDGEIEKEEDGEPKTQTVKKTVTNQIIKLEEVAGNEPHQNSFINKLISTAESKVEAGASAITVNIDWAEGDKAIDVKAEDGTDKKGEYKYTGVKVNYIIDGMTELVTGGIKNTETVKLTDIYGKSHDLKDAELFYHVYPISFVAVENTLTADSVLNYFVSALLATETDDEGESVYSVDFVELEVYKNGEEKLVDILTELKNLLDSQKSALDARDKAQKDVDAKQKIVDNAGGEDKATATEKANLATAKEDLKNAEEKLTEAQGKVKEQIEKVYGCTAEGRDIKTDIVEGSTAYRYDTLEKAYKSALKNSIAKEIFALAEKYITYKTNSDGTPVLPKKAVNAAYKRLENNLKYDFHEGNFTSSSSSSSSSSVTNYVKFNGDFNAYLRDELDLADTAGKKEIEAAIGAKAEQSVRDIILVYTLAELYGEDVAVTEEDIDEFKNSWQYWLLTYQVGEDNVDDNDYIHAIQLDNVLNYLLEEKSVSDKDEDKGAVEYERVKYKIKKD